MAGLERHYGVNASLDEASKRDISRFLEERASRRDKHSPAEASARLTRTAWFDHEHGSHSPRRIPFSRCTGCHEGAGRGDFNDH